MTKTVKKQPEKKYKPTPISATQEANQKALIIGQGNLSKGYRIALEAYRIDPDRKAENVA